MSFETVTIGPCTLIRGDCLEYLASMRTDSVDITVTSPPYNTLPASHNPSGMHAERRSGVNRWIQNAADGYADQRPEPEYQEWLRSVVGECLRVSRGLVWVNHKVRYRDGVALHPARILPWDIYAEVIWNRRGSMALNCKRFAPSHEGIWAFGAPHFWNDALNTDLSVWDIRPDSGADTHPCAFPLEIARRPIVASCPSGGVVFEPFLGSGTTAEACIREGMSCIGCENNPKHFDDACERIRKAWKLERSKLPLEPQPVMKQQELLTA